MKTEMIFNLHEIETGKLTAKGDDDQGLVALMLLASAYSGQFEIRYKKTLIWRSDMSTSEARFDSCNMDIDDLLADRCNEVRRAAAPLIFNDNLVDLVLAKNPASPGKRYSRASVRRALENAGHMREPITDYLHHDRS